MSLINELREKSNKVEQTKQEVIEEIKAYFDDYFKTNKLEEWLKRQSECYIKKREIPVFVEFWEHHNGCSATHFSCGGCCWKNKEDEYSWYYKGVYLKELQTKICEYLKVIVKEQMIKLGFDYKREEPQSSWLGYYKNILYFGW